MTDLKSFNEMLKELEGAGSTNIEDQTTTLAKKLLAQGIATNMMEAKEKARTMLGTEKRAQQGFDQKKGEQTVYNDPRSNPDYYKKQNIEELRKRAMSRPQILKVQDQFQTPGFERKNGSTGLPNAVPGISREQQGKANIGFTQQKPVHPRPNTLTPDAADVQRAQEPTPQPTTKKPVNEEKRKKNPEIDLTQMFNFGKR